MGTVERLKKTPRESWEILVSTWGIWLLNAFDMGVILALGATLIGLFGFSSYEWFLIVGGLYLVRAIFTIPWSVLSDKWGSGWKRRRLWGVLIAFYSIVSAVCILPAVALNKFLFWPVRFLVQLTSESGETIATAVVSEWFPDESRGFAVGLQHTGFPIGFLVAGVAASWVMNTFGQDRWYLVFAGTLISFVFLTWYWYRSTPGDQNRVYEKIKERGLTPPHGGETVNSPESLGDIFTVFGKTNVQVTTVYIAVSMAVWTLWVSIFPAFMTNIVGVAYENAAALSVVWTLTGAFFQFFWPTVSDSIGRKRLLVVASLWMGSTFLFLPFVNSIVTIIALQLAYGLFLNAVYPLGFALIIDSASDNAVATGLSVSTAGMWLGGGVIMIALSPIIDMFGGWGAAQGYHVLFAIMVVLTYAMAILMYVYGEETVGPHADVDRSTDPATAD